MSDGDKIPDSVKNPPSLPSDITEEEVRARMDELAKAIAPVDQDPDQQAAPTRTVASVDPGATDSARETPQERATKRLAEINARLQITPTMRRGDEEGRRWIQDVEGEGERVSADEVAAVAEDGEIRPTSAGKPVLYANDGKRYLRQEVRVGRGKSVRTTTSWDDELVQFRNVYSQGRWWHWDTAADDFIRGGDKPFTGDGTEATLAAERARATPTRGGIEMQEDLGNAVLTKSVDGTYTKFTRGRFERNVETGKSYRLTIAGQIRSITFAPDLKSYQWTTLGAQPMNPANPIADPPRQREARRQQELNLWGRRVRRTIEGGVERHEIYAKGQDGRPVWQELVDEARYPVVRGNERGTAAWEVDFSNFKDFRKDGEEASDATETEDDPETAAHKAELARIQRERDRIARERELVEERQRHAAAAAALEAATRTTTPEARGPSALERWRDTGEATHQAERDRAFNKALHIRNFAAMSDAQKINRMQTLYDVSQKWKNIPLWKKVSVGLGFLSAGALGSAFLPGLAAAGWWGALGWRAAGSLMTGVGTGFAAREYMNKRNYAEATADKAGFWTGLGTGILTMFGGQWLASYFKLDFVEGKGDKWKTSSGAESGPAQVISDGAKGITHAIKNK